MTADSLNLSTLLFSRTDKRGDIVSCNQAFAEACGYDVSELTGQPHRNLRHPRLPNGAMWIMWDRNKRGLVTGLYSHNQTRDGGDLWVFTVISPIDDGYTSIRFAPNSELFGEIKQMYKTLVQREQDEALQPEASAKLFLEMLAERGYPSYDSFMYEAIAREHRGRHEQLDGTEDPSFAPLDHLNNACIAIKTECDGIVANRKAISLAPTNLRLNAKRFSSEGKTIGVIAENFTVVSAEKMRRLETLTKVLETCCNVVSKSLALSCICAMQQEMAEKFRENDSGQQRSIEILGEQTIHYGAQVQEGLVEVTRDAGRIPKLCSDLKRSLLGLAMVRVMCKMEAAALAVKAPGAMAMVDDIATYVDNANGHVEAIQDHLPELITDLSKLSNVKPRIAA